MTTNIKIGTWWIKLVRFMYFVGTGYSVSTATVYALQKDYQSTLLYVCLTGIIGSAALSMDGAYKLIKKLQEEKSS